MPSGCFCAGSGAVGSCSIQEHSEQHTRHYRLAGNGERLAKWCINPRSDSWNSTSMVSGHPTVSRRAMKRVRIDPITCAGHGLCAELPPERILRRVRHIS
jgi:hypothetical protein